MKGNRQKMALTVPEYETFWDFWVTRLAHTAALSEVGVGRR